MAALLAEEDEADGWISPQTGDQSMLAKKWFECSMACLYRSNFLQCHTIFSVQAICVLVVSGQDAA
jgi:hypothetical protein